MLCQDNDESHHTSFQPSFPPTNDEEQSEVEMLNLLRSYKDEFQNNLYNIESGTKCSENNQVIQNVQQNQHSSLNSSSSLEENSFMLEKDLKNGSEAHSSSSVDRMTNNFITSSNNFTKRNQNSDLILYSKSVKHLSDDETLLHKDTDMRYLIGTPLSEINHKNKNTFSGISKLSTMQNDDSRDNHSFLDHTIINQPPLNDIIFDKSNGNPQFSNIPESSNSNSFFNKETSLISSLDGESGFKSESNKNGNEIPLGISLNSKTSMNNFLPNQNEFKSHNENSTIKDDNNRLSLVEFRQNGKNYSGEFVSRKPSLMTVIEDDAEVIFEYEEDYEEDTEVENNDKKDEDKINNLETNTKFTCNFDSNITSKESKFGQASETQQNLYMRIYNQMPIQGNSKSVSLNNCIKSYGGFNSKIIDLNPPDEDNDEYDEHEVSPISLSEASDINRASHQSGLSGSRTIEDLIQEQKKATFNASSSAILVLAKAAAREETKEENFDNNKKSIKRGSNISLGEFISRERTCFTVEDMMRLQNIHLTVNKNLTNNSSDKIVKGQKSLYTEEEMIKDQKITMKSNLSENVNFSNPPQKSEHISSLIDRTLKVDPLPNSNEITLSNTVSRDIKLDNNENIIPSIDEQNLENKEKSSELNSSNLNEKLNEEQNKTHIEQTKPEIIDKTNEDTESSINHHSTFFNESNESSKCEMKRSFSEQMNNTYQKIAKIFIFSIMIFSLIILYNYN